MKIKAASKVASVFALMAAFVAQSLWLGVRYRGRWQKNSQRAQLVSKYSRRALKVLGVETKCLGRLSPRGDNALFVGNHLSYLDVLIIASQIPTQFVTSEEIRAAPGLGVLCELGGCLFVERRSRAKLKTEVKELSEALRNGLSVTVFPEATSTNGSQVLRFRRPLFQAAMDAGCVVAPFCLNYRFIDQKPIDTRNRDVVCWYGDMNFISHLYTLAQYQNILVELNWLPRHRSDVEMTCEDLAARCHADVLQVFEPFKAAALSNPTTVECFSSTLEASPQRA